MLEEDLHKSYKKYLKILIEEYLKNITFQKSPQADEPDNLCSDHLWSIQFDAIDIAWAKLKFNFRTSK